jgi:hypothetical protein|tara:strand:+ start:214 stop:405 length:192 start_codon:yes stop_codon:yes gene_type:complete
MARLALAIDPQVSQHKVVSGGVIGIDSSEVLGDLQCGAPAPVRSASQPNHLSDPVDVGIEWDH